MVLTSLGEHRVSIEQDTIIQRLLSGPQREKLTGILNELFPVGDSEVMGQKQLRVRATLCGNRLSKDNPELMLVGAMVTIQILQAIGNEETARRLQETID